ncbi:MAG: hypothetical protein HN366_23585 [Deltaproteobacteria bacterium]|nr:hypothetical protein [Deltaproteobacteria bacterium]
MKKPPDYSEILLVHFRRVESLKEAALDYPSISLNKRQLCDLELLLNRAWRFVSSRTAKGSMPGRVKVI